MLAANLEPNKFRLAYRVLHQGRIKTRAIIAGDSIAWNMNPPHVEPLSQQLKGRFEIVVPKGATVHCTAIYDGFAFNQRWIFDPSTSQNPMRATYAEFDRDLKTLEDLVLNPRSTGNSRDLELGVSCLLWMLGFHPIHLGGLPRKSDAPDLIASTDQGDFLVVECTTGPIPGDKVSQLISRTETIKSRLASSGWQNLRVLPVMVTSRESSAITSDKDEAEKKGVLVATRELLEDALRRSLFVPNANTLFDEMYNSLHSQLSVIKE